MNEVLEQPFDDDLCDGLEQFYSQDSQTGPKVNDRLSELIDTMLRAKVSDEKMKEKAGRFKQPQNCENLLLPKINPEIWSKMASRAKSRDLNLQNVQLYLIIGLIPVIQSLQKLYDWRKMAKKAVNKSVSISDEDLSGIASDFCDSFSLLAHSNYQICLRRMEFIKPELNAQFRSLCTSAPIISWLFGDDICGQIKDLQQHNQIGVRLTQSRSRLSPTGSGLQSTTRKYRARAYDHARRGGFYGHTVATKEKPEETSIIQRGSQLKLNSDNMVNTNVFASISFQENDKVFPKVEKSGGKLRNFEHEWQKITNDPEILTYIRRCPIDFENLFHIRNLPTTWLLVVRNVR